MAYIVCFLMEFFVKIRYIVQKIIKEYTMSDFNIYCDESCHLPNDGEQVMVLGATSCPLDKTKEITKRLREIKKKHGLHPNFEIKWGKVSQAKLLFYLDIVDYFFDDDDFIFRCVVIDKTTINHQKYSQTHDEWYYKMMFLLLRNIVKPRAKSFIYLDKKDTQGGEKVKKLHNVLCNSNYDFNQDRIKRVQIVESHHVEQMQVADLLLGALCYLNRGLQSNEAKRVIIERIKERSGYQLNASTLPSEPKFNIFYWRGGYYE